MPARIPDKPVQIDADLLKRLDDFIEENYIPEELIPKDTPFIAVRNSVSISRRRGVKETREKK